MSNITGAEPTVFGKNRGILFRALIVALHYVSAFYQELAVLGQANLYTVYDAPDRADAVMVFGITGYGRRCLGQPVALQNGYSGPGKSVGDFGGQCRAA